MKEKVFAFLKTIPREKLTKRELPYTIGMIALDIAAPILLMLGLQHTHEHSHSHTD